MATALEDDKLRQEILELQDLVFSFQKVFQDKGQLDGLAILGSNVCKHPRCAFRTHYPQSLLEHELRGDHYNFVVKSLTANQRQEVLSVLPSAFSSRGAVSLEGSAFEHCSQPSTQSSNLTEIVADPGAITLPCLPFGSTFTASPIYSESVPSKSFGNPSLSPRMPPIQGFKDNPNYHEKFARSNVTQASKPSARLTCDTCLKNFTRVATLRDHILSHNDLRPFACGLCGKAFARLKDQKRHASIHLAEKNYVCGGRSLKERDWGCGRQFAREDGLPAHFRSETAETCLAPLLDSEDFYRWLRASNDGLIVCKDTSEKGKQWGCALQFAREADMKIHFELSGGKGCIRQIVIRFAMGLLRTLRGCQLSKVMPSAGELSQRRPAILAKPSLIPWHPSPIAGALGELEMHISMTESTDRNWIEIPRFELQLSHTEGSAEGDVWGHSGMSAQEELANRTSGAQWQSVIDEVDSLLGDRFDSLASPSQWLATAYRAGSNEAIDALIATVVSPHLLQDNLIWVKFGEAKCKATWTACQQPKSARTVLVYPSDWYEYRVSATVPSFSTTGSRSSLVKLGLLIDHISRYLEPFGGIEELSIGEFAYYGELS